MADADPVAGKVSAMAGFEASEIIERPAEEVFRFVEDTANASKWVGEGVRIEPLTEGPMRAGWRFKETRRMGGRDASAEIEIRVHDGPGPGRKPPYRHAAGGSAMGVDAEYDFTFHELDARRTKVEVVCRVKPTNILGRAFAGVAVKAMQKQDGDMLQRMKRAIEGTR